MSDNLLVTEEGNPTPVHVGDAAHKALRVNLVASDAPISVSATTVATATAAPPTYSEGVPSAISQDLSGNLRVAIGSIGLPAGASTAAKQDTGNASLASIDGKLTNPLPVSGPLTDTQMRASAVPVSAAALPLPSNAAQETGGNLATIAAKDFATQATLALIKAKTDNLDAALSTLATQATLAQIKTDVDKIPANPATDRSTAAAPFAVRTSDGSAFFDPRNVLEDATNTVVQPGDATNKAIRVNVVASTGSTTFFGITESSTGDGTTATLTLGHTPTDEPRVFVDRIRQVLNTDYTRSGAVITWIVIPGSGAPIQVDYTWSLASATLASTLVVDVNGHVLPTGDAAARSIHVTVDSASTDTTLAGTLKTQPLEKTGFNSLSLQRRSAELALLVALDQQRLSLRSRQGERMSPAYQTRGQR